MVYVFNRATYDLLLLPVFNNNSSSRRTIIIDVRLFSLRADLETGKIAMIRRIPLVPRRLLMHRVMNIRLFESMRMRRQGRPARDLSQDEDIA
jgi:hypothetical protein